MSQLKTAANKEVHLKGQLEEAEIKYDNLLMINKQQELQIDKANRQVEASELKNSTLLKSTVDNKKGWLMRAYKNTFSVTVACHCNTLYCS